MHPSIRRAYEERTHPFINHPIHGVYGKDLAYAQHDYIKAKYDESGGPRTTNQGGLMRWLMPLLYKIMRTEQPHADELEQLAIKVVKEVWQITDELDFNAKLVQPQDFTAPPLEQEPPQPDIEGEEEGEEEETITPAEKGEIDKRITMNSLIHGAAAHQMVTMHHLVKNEITTIDPNLMKMYDQIARASIYTHWLTDIAQVAELAGQGGEESIQWPEMEEGGEGAIIVNAKAVIFPLLVHELSKGVMEVLAAHGLPKDPQLLKKVYKHADVLKDEFFHYLVGPEIWRRFIKIIKPKDLSRVISTLATQSPGNIHKIIGEVIDNPEQAQQIVNDMMGGGKMEPRVESKSKKLKPKVESKDLISTIADQITEDPDVMAEPKPTPTIPMPKTPPMPRPGPSTPGPAPDKTPTPFRPPKPAEDPRPKARRHPTGLRTLHNR